MTVLAFGDSLVHGYGLNPKDGFVPQLQNWLAAREIDAEIVNAGVSGETTAGGLARIDWTLDSDPDALILSLGGNDVLRGLLPRDTRHNLEEILSRTKEAAVPVLLIGQGAPANYGEDYKQEFEAIFPSLADEYQTLLFPSFFAPLEEAGSLTEILQTYFQDDGIHPNAAGVARIVDAMGPHIVQLVERAAARPVPDQTYVRFWGVENVLSDNVPHSNWKRVIVLGRNDHSIESRMASGGLIW